MEETKRIATGVDWLFAPKWLTIEEACFLYWNFQGLCLIGSETEQQ